MSSGGPGFPISPQDAFGLLHKLITEFTKVHVAFTAAEGRVRFAVSGRVSVSPDNTFAVVEYPERAGSTLFAFDPALAVFFKYADARELPDGGKDPAGNTFRSILVLGFKDKSSLALFEFSSDDDGVR